MIRSLGPPPPNTMVLATTVIAGKCKKINCLPLDRSCTCAT